jgi:tetratricopeptide (TPR) repeat protein
MRLVKQLAELFARALKLKQEKKYDEAGACLESGCLTLFGIDWKTLSWADSASAAQLLKEPARIRAFAELLEQRAELYEAAGQPAEARSKWQHAFEMYREAGDHAEARAGAERTGKRIDVLLLPEKYR